MFEIQSVREITMMQAKHHQAPGHICRMSITASVALFMLVMLMSCAFQQAHASCSPSISPYIQVIGGTWQQTASATVSSGSTVDLGPQPASGGSWSWSGPSGYTSSSRQISVTVSSSSAYTATYTNTSGCRSTQPFTFTVAPTPTPTPTPGPAAPIGTGWTEVNPPSNIQIESNGTGYEYPGTSTNLSNADGRFTSQSIGSGDYLETFELLGTTSNRVERRYLDEYSSGSEQFAAEVLISTPTNNECIHQIFNGSTAPWLIVREENTNNGSLLITLHTGGNSGILVSNLYGKWFQLNSINDMNTHKAYIYIDGKLIYEATNPGGTFYTKYGDYGTLGAASAKVQFRNVRRYSGGTP